jgi:myo-inositol-1-phosphate synthase
LVGPAAYFMKSPPIQYTDDEARIMTESFIENKEQSTPVTLTGGEKAPSKRRRKGTASNS